MSLNANNKSEKRGWGGVTFTPPLKGTQRGLHSGFILNVKSWGGVGYQGRVQSSRLYDVTTD